LMSYGYRTDAEQLSFLQKRIERLEKTLERAEREYLIINSRMQGEPINPHFKEMVICKRPQY
jgi:hypothetical protein